MKAERPFLAGDRSRQFASRTGAGESSRVRGRRVGSVWGFADLNDPAGAILFRISGSTN